MKKHDRQWVKAPTEWFEGKTIRRATMYENFGRMEGEQELILEFSDDTAALVYGVWWNIGDAGTEFMVSES